MPLPRAASETTGGASPSPTGSLPSEKPLIRRFGASVSLRRFAASRGKTLGGRASRRCDADLPLIRPRAARPPSPEGEGFERAHSANRRRQLPRFHVRPTILLDEALQVSDEAGRQPPLFHVRPTILLDEALQVSAAVGRQLPPPQIPTRLRWVKKEPAPDGSGLFSFALRGVGRLCSYFAAGASMVT